MGCCKSRRRWLEPTVDYDPDFREQAKVVGHTYHCPHGHLMEKLVTHKAGYLRCDVCGRPQGVGRRMQGCWDCDYHVCQSCEKQFEDKEWYASWFKFWHGDAQVSPEVEECSAASTVTPRKVPKCPRQHTLCEYFKPEEPPVQCDVCGKRLAPYVRIWGCPECDYDVGPCCEQNFEDPDFLLQWRRWHQVPEDLEEDPPMPAPPEPPSSQLSSLNSSPKVTRIKPQQLDVTQELLQKEKESKKAMVLGGRCEVVAPALMTAVLQQGPNPSEKPSQQPVIGVKEPPVILKITKKKKDFSKLPEEPQSSGEQGPDDGTSPVPEPLPDEVVETDGPRASRSSVMPEPPEEWPVEETPEVPTEAAEEAPTEAAQVVNEESRRKRRDKHRDRERRDDKEKKERRHGKDSKERDTSGTQPVVRLAGVEEEQEAKEEKPEAEKRRRKKKTRRDVANRDGGE